MPMNVREMFHVKHWLRRQVAMTIVMLTAALAGCSSPEQIAETAGASTPAPPPAPPAADPGKVAFTDNAKQGEAAREFAYEWPAAVTAVPQLVERFTAERDKTLAEQKSDWQSILAEMAGEDCTACKSLTFSKSWAVVADLPRFLSLSAEMYFYTGGAHGNSGFDALVWDREAGAAFDPRAMFRSPQALQAALGDPWCKSLKAERQKRLGSDYSDDGFFPCPSIADLTVLVGSSDKRAFDRIGLIAGPYVAGSYAEGPYELTFPVTPAVMDAVKPEYRPAFALGK
jgi:hypothetical protein